MCCIKFSRNLVFLFLLFGVVQRLCLLVGWLSECWQKFYDKYFAGGEKSSCVGHTGSYKTFSGIR